MTASNALETLVTAGLALGLLYLVMVLPLMKIIQRAGFSRWWVLAVFVPFVNVVFFYLFAFGRWPIEERLEIAERNAAARAEQAP